MDLRERTVYLRCSTWEDLLGDNRIAGLVDRIELLTGEPFLVSQDMGSGRRQRPSRPLAGRVVLEELSELGVHAAASVKLYTTEPGSSGPRTELSIEAGPHPYTGSYRCSLDLRVPSDRFDADFTERYVSFVRHLIEVARPFVGHAHDTDDTLIQNTASAAILRRAFGVELEEDADVQTNAGYEVSRGEFRYLAAWLMIYGPAMVEQVDEATMNDLPVPAEEVVDGTWLLRLYGRPDQAADPASREAQRAVRSALNFDELAADKAWAFGFWDRSSRS